MTDNKLKTDSKYDDYDFPSISPEKKPGHPGHTTPEQDAQVFQLRTQLEQAGCTQRLDTLSMVCDLRLPDPLPVLTWSSLVTIPPSAKIQCRAGQANV